MNNFYELFTVEGDDDLFHVFRFDARNDSYDNLPSHLAKKLHATFDFTDSPSTSDEFAGADWDTSVLITVVLDVLNILKNKFDLDSQILDGILAIRRSETTAKILDAFNLTHLSDEPFIYVFKNITEQECFQLLLIDGNCRVSSFRKSQVGDAKILRNCVWNMQWSLGLRSSFYEYDSDPELEEIGVINGDLTGFHIDKVKNSIRSYVSDSKESWIVENGLKSVRKYKEKKDLKDSEILEILELIVLIKVKAIEIFKKRFS